MADTDYPIYSDGDKTYFAPLFDVGDGLYSATPISDGSVKTMGHTEAAVHDGNHYYVSGHASLASDAELRVKLVTPDTAVRAHLRWAISSSGSLTTELFEGASGGMANGTGVTPLNNDRNSTDASTLTLTSGVDAATDDGTLIDSAAWGSATKFVSGAGGAGRDDELILKQNTIYLRKFTSAEADNIVSFKAFWVEE